MSAASPAQHSGNTARTKSTFDALVLDANARQSLVAIRSMGRRGLSIAALETFGSAPAFSSRWCREGFVSRGGYATDSYLRDIEAILDHQEASILIPSHDGTIALIRQYRAQLERLTGVALASEPALSIAVSKERTLAIAKELGLAVPPSVVVATKEDVPAAIREIGLPAVLKPNESWIGPAGQGIRLASRIVASLSEAMQAVAHLTRFGGTTLVQPLLTGRREAVMLLYADGKVHARFAQWAQRTDPPLGGDSVLRQSIPVPNDIGTQSERLVGDINLDGYSEVEFRRDGKGVPYLMEINPRLSASVELAVRSGVDFPFLLYQWAKGGPIDVVETYRVGGWMRYLQGDVRTTMASLQLQGRPGIAPAGRAVRDFVLAFLKPMAYDYFAWDDPAPALKAAAHFLRIGGRMARMRTGRHERVRRGS
jgi:predicted ATP-grasp superfamily ATP-dependent carboligase